jgi:hypothetical protein
MLPLASHKALSSVQLCAFTTHLGGPGVHALEPGGSGHAKALYPSNEFDSQQPTVYCANGKPGTTPVSLFIHKSSRVSAFKSAIPLGIAPAMLLLGKLSDDKYVIADQCAGRVPARFADQLE